MNMKKTLIALAVAASAAVSGSAMAWEANGSGGSVSVGGTLTPADAVTPWEVKVGDAVSGLEADIQKGQQTVKIKTASAIPVLGIRTQTSNVFTGQSGISPQIDFNGAVDVDGFSAGVTTLTLNVTDANGNKSGTLSAPFLAAAAISRASDKIAFSAYVYGGYSVSSFAGGLGASSDQVLPTLAEVISRLNAIDSEFSANFNDQQYTRSDGTWRSSAFDDSSDTFSGFYGSGIESGQKITITLDEAASGDAPIEWKASLPVTVTYA